MEELCKTASNFFYFRLGPFFVAQNTARARVSLFSPLCFAREIRYVFFEFSKSFFDHQNYSNRETKKVGCVFDDVLSGSQRKKFYLFWARRITVQKFGLKRFNFWTFSYSDWTQNRWVFYTLVTSLSYSQLVWMNWIIILLLFERCVPE